MEIIVREPSQKEGLGNSRHQRSQSWNTDRAEKRDKILPEQHLDIKTDVNGSDNNSPREEKPKLRIMRSSSSSPRRNSRLLSLRSRGDSFSASASSSPKDSSSVDHSPRLSSSSSNSPRKTLNHVVSRLKKPDEKDLEDKSKREEQMLRDKKKYDVVNSTNRKYGDHNYEMSYYAGAGDFDKIKDIILKNQYTQDDLIASIEVAEKCGHLKIAEYMKGFQDFF